MPRLKKSEMEQVDLNLKSVIAFGRVQFSYSNDDLAKLLGISPATLRRKLRDPNKITLGEIRRLKKLLKLSADDVCKMV